MIVRQIPPSSQKFISSEYEEKGAERARELHASTRFDPALSQQQEDDRIHFN